MLATDTIQVNGVDPLLIPMRDVARLVGLSSRELYRAIGRGQLHTVLVGRRRLVPMSALRAYVAAIEAQGSDE